MDFTKRTFDLGYTRIKISELAKLKKNSLVHEIWFSLFIKISINVYLAQTPFRLKISYNLNP